MKCTDKEWQHCRVEKMGCTGCHYDEDKIQVGYYVRTNKGEIRKIIKIDSKLVIVGHGMQDMEYFCKFNKGECIYGETYNKLIINIKEYITKHSQSIIDLIEEGDILRYKLKGLKNEYITVVKKCYDARSNENWLLINGYKLEQVEILEILTKEQYIKNCFKVVQE